MTAAATQRGGPTGSAAAFGASHEAPRSSSCDAAAGTPAAVPWRAVIAADLPGGRRETQPTARARRTAFVERRSGELTSRRAIASGPPRPRQTPSASPATATPAAVLHGKVRQRALFGGRAMATPGHGPQRARELGVEPRAVRRKVNESDRPAEAATPRREEALSRGQEGEPAGAQARARRDREPARSAHEDRRGELLPRGARDRHQEGRGDGPGGVRGAPRRRARDRRASPGGPERRALRGEDDGPGGARRAPRRGGGEGNVQARRDAPARLRAFRPGRPGAPDRFGRSRSLTATAQAATSRSLRR